MRTRVHKVRYVLYHHDTSEELLVREFAIGSAPPVPRDGDFIAIGGVLDTTYKVLQVTHYFESPHEVAIVVSDNALTPMVAEETSPQVPYQVPRDAQGNCAYCHDEECYGGVDCNFYDGSLG